MNLSSTKRPRRLPRDEWERLKRLTVFEVEARLQGYKRIAGVDEAGRGPLAGPVVAAACVIPEGVLFEGVNDSKLLTSLKRGRLFRDLTDHPEVEIGVGIADADLIDEINIYQATLVAMRLALEALAERPDFLLIDAMQLDFYGVPCRKIIKGDQLSHTIAAASVIAKERRDELMREYHVLYPEYGFDAHKGYGTEKHLEALERHGPCPIHRRSFKRKIYVT